MFQENSKQYNVPNLGGELQKQIDPRPMDIFDELREAQSRWNRACHAFTEAQQERSQAEKFLSDISEKVNQIMRQAMLDPTQPQPAVGTPAGNGRY